MANQNFLYESELSFSREEVFDWHSRPGALESLTPPWEDVRILSRAGTGIEVGSSVTLQMKLGLLPFEWMAEHTTLERPSLFIDRATKGPFAHWEHHHIFQELAESRTRMTDRVHFRLPLAPLSNFALPSVQKKLTQAFRYRHTTLVNDLAIQHRYQNQPKSTFLLSGASGLIGRRLKAFLETAGHSVIQLVRREPRTNSERRWDPSRGELPSDVFNGIDTVIHLSGEPIAEKRWTKVQRERIRNSRVQSTRLLASAMTNAPQKPRKFLCASAIGMYGDRSDELLHEQSSTGDLFVSEVGREWESAADPCRATNIRTVNFRIGIVLSPAGGALSKMLLPFQLGGGGKLGDGNQYMSWISLDDLVYALYHVWATDSISSVVNLTAPNPVTNSSFTATLGKVLRRPTLFSVPKTVLRLALGQMADELLLASTRVEPKALVDSGFTFTQPNLEGALRHLLGR